MRRVKKLASNSMFKKLRSCARFGSTYTKIGTIQIRSAWPLRKDDPQIREAFHIFELRRLKKKKTKIMVSGPITSWQIGGETVETVVDVIFGELQNHCRW